MNDDKFKLMLHDIIYDMLVSMSQESVFTDGEYNKGYVDGLGEAFRIITEKLALFDVENFPNGLRLPKVEEWLRDGPRAVNLPTR